MALYFKETEITNIDNLVPQTGLDITDLWFGSTNVYTVWQTYEGTLPATFNANGDDMRKYQIYGATGGVGDRTENIYNGTIMQGYYSFSTGEFTPSASLLSKWVCTDIIPCEQNTTYGVMVQLEEPLKSRSYGFVWYDENFNFLRSNNGTTLSNPVRYAANSQDAAYMALNFAGTVNNTNIYPSNIKNITLTPGTTPPEAYVPYGYKLDMATSDGTNTTTTPIYIGSDPLEKDEYVDYTEQKVYRRTTNKYDISTQTKNSGLSVNGSTVSSATSSRSDYIAVAPETTYTKKANAVDTVNRITQFFDSNRQFLSNTTPDSSQIPQTFTTPNNCAFVRIAYPIDSTQVMLVEGTTAPAQFIPYLQPTDPPVPLPALPTCEGTTIVDYAGSGTAPEKVLLKYRKENF